MKKNFDFKKNDEFILDIDDNGSKAEGIGRVNGYSFFVKDVIKGERIKAGVTKLKKNYGYARCLEIIQKSLNRVVPECRYYKHCGGCNIQHMSYKAQTEYKLDKINSALIKIGGLNVRAEKLIAADNEYRYRNKAQYPVGYSEKGEMIAGLYSERSHKIVGVDDCLLEPKINAYIIKRIVAFCKKNGIKAYKEEKHSGLLRHIMIRHGFKTGEIMVGLVVNTLKRADLYFLSDLFSELNEEINLFNAKNSLKYNFSSFVVNYNNDKTNVVMSEKTEVIYGENYILDEMNGIGYAIGANSFYQVNHEQAEKLYQEVLNIAELNQTDIVYDMYCGAGTIGLYLANHVKQVYGAEIVKEAVEMAKFNASLNHIENAEFFCGSADDVAAMLYKEKGIIPNVIVVDPPRKGCSGEMLFNILEIAPEKIVYVSCDPATMARDLKILSESGNYEVQKVVGVDQFCQTFHVESIALLSKLTSEKFINVELSSDEMEKLGNEELLFRI